jgi:hypothetical protein
LPAATQAAFKIPDYKSTTGFKADGKEISRLWTGFPLLMSIVYTTEDPADPLLEAERFHLLAHTFREIFTQLNLPADKTDAEIHALQFQMDEFSRLYVDMFSTHDVSHYIHNLQVTLVCALHDSIILPICSHTNYYVFIYLIQEWPLKEPATDAQEPIQVRQYRTRGAYQGGEDCNTQRDTGWRPLWQSAQ